MVMVMVVAVVVDSTCASASPASPPPPSPPPPPESAIMVSRVLFVKFCKDSGKAFKNKKGMVEVTVGAMVGSEVIVKVYCE